jgi:hypothetical protein
MEYVLIVGLQLIGIGFHVGQKVLQLDSNSPDDSLQDVMKVFWRSDRITVFISGLILILNVLAHYIVETYAINITHIVWMGIPYIIWSFILALVLGYGGQRILYNYLGKAEKFLNDKAEKIIK